MRFYIRKPDGAIMTAAETENLPRSTRPFSGGNAWASMFVAYRVRELLGDGYRVVAADSQPPDHEIRYFIRKPNGHLLTRDEARSLDGAYWLQDQLNDGERVREIAEACVNQLNRNARHDKYAVVPREVLK
jgi:hypothetical protein